MAKKSGNYYISECENHGCAIKNGHGDHKKIYPPSGYAGSPSMLIIPSNLKGNGTEHSIIKVLVKWGVLLFAAYLILEYLEVL